MKQINLDEVLSAQTGLTSSVTEPEIPKPGG
jgi:hypothetical protein